MTRRLVVWCPDWPVVAAGATAVTAAGRPTGVVAGNHIVACSALARSAGVRRGMRRRDAQARCPELVLFADDPARDARLFEPVAAAIEELAVGVEIVRPGVVAVPARGPVGYFGGEEPTAERLIDQVAARTGVECQVGIADGLFAALLAAHRGQLVEPGHSADFLAPLSVRELNRPAEGQHRTDLVDLLRRLGLRTLGAFAAVPERDVSARFGTDAVLAHRQARGLEERPPARRRPPPELSVTETLDPPVTRVDAAAFAARALAELFHAGLAAHGFACTRLGIHASTEHGEERGRVWRSAEPLTPAGVADRVRWQLEGWLRDERLSESMLDPASRPSAGITTLRLEPVEVVEGTSLQLDLWRGAGTAAADERAGRAMVHVQGLLGPDAVCVPVLGGGRSPAERVRLVPWGDERTPAMDPDAPWPGRLPAPSPATVLPEPAPATVRDKTGATVGVSPWYELTAVPVEIALAGRPPMRVVDIAGPWPADERWWATHRRRTRIQALLEQSEKDCPIAVLLTCENERWTVEGMYD